MMTKKQHMFRRKWTTYNEHAVQYNDIRPVSHIPCPTLEEAKALPFEDSFWNVGALDHPSEMWANDPGTKAGIQAYLLERGCLEELRRIGRETQQMTLAALRTEEQLQDLLTLCHSGT